MSAPVLALMIIRLSQQANANWAMTAFPALTILLAGWLGKMQNQFMELSRLVSIRVKPINSVGNSFWQYGPFTPQSTLRRLRGWQQLA